VEVVTEGIAEVRPHSIVTRDGEECPVDVIVLATGFAATDPPLSHAVRGRDGRSLAETWAGSPRAHLGITVAGFPNLFMLMGPNTGLGHSSVIYMIEAQVEHVLAALRWMGGSGAGAIEPLPEAQAEFVSAVERRMEGTVWTSGGCRSWYLDETGRNSTLWPDFTWRFRRRAARFRPEEYAAEPARRAEPAPVAA
jgi:cation diffusion facilitator CzcD-associated flavoprotein CzcO